MSFRKQQKKLHSGESKLDQLSDKDLVSDTRPSVDLESVEHWCWYFDNCHHWENIDDPVEQERVARRMMLEAGFITKWFLKEMDEQRLSCVAGVEGEA